MTYVKNNNDVFRKRLRLQQDLYQNNNNGFHWVKEL